MSMRNINLAIWHFVCLCCLGTPWASALAEMPVPKNVMMCHPGELLFSDDFDPATVSDRWFFRGEFALRDGALLRTDVDPTNVKRVFLKEASFHNTIIQFDFKLSGKTTDLRLVTGSGGGYNSITQIRPDHFQVNTPVDRAAGMVPAHLGECIRQAKPDQWQTLTVEYWNDEVVAHLSASEFVIGRHPIIDRTRTYFAFQFDFSGASIDNVRVWKANGQRDDWDERRQQLAMSQSQRAAVPRDPVDRYRYEYTQLKSRLTLNDSAYRDLVAKHANLQNALHEAYPEAFITHKQVSKRIAKKKQQIKSAEPEFKVLETAVHRARRAEDDYILSTKPQLTQLKAEGIPKHRFESELGQVRAQREAAGDKQLAALVAATAACQTALEARFPAAFETVDAQIGKRNARRKQLDEDPGFRNRNREVVDAGRAVKEYEEQAAPHLVKLAADAKAYSDSQRSVDKP